ncbi:MAG: STAS domain-containing protein [Burkholderiales bacterium]|nr:STAS domain-containing protein [Burkholderiales bacterium]
MALPLHPFQPYLLKSLRDYRADNLGHDLAAGLTVGIVALPLAMAFAIASGVKPEAGIFTAIIAGFLVSALGGSRVQIGGPAGAFIVIVYGIVAKYGLANLLLSTIMAGVLMFVMGLTRLGSLIRFIPVSIIIGFTNGIAVLIALSQIKDFFGLSIPGSVPAEFFALLRTLAAHAHTAHVPTIALAASALAVVVAWPRLTGAIRGRFRFLARLPGSIVALALATLAAAALQLPVETIGSRFGGIPQALPAFALPAFDWQTARNLVAPTLTIALLGAIESLLCARVADAMIDDRHDPNQELMAQGVANVVGPFFGCIPATGTIARTTTNVRSGARSPVAGMIHALTLLAIVLVAAPVARHVPLAALAAILAFVAFNMGEWSEFARLRQFSVPYRITMVSTFVLTVVLDLTVAVEVGLVLACLFFIYRIGSLTSVEAIDPAGLPPRTVGYRLFGSLFFGAVGKLEALVTVADGTPMRVLVLDLHHVINIDTTGLDTLDAIRRTLARRGIALLLCDVHAQPRSLIQRAGFAAALGPDNLLQDLDAALARARAIVAADAAEAGRA